MAIRLSPACRLLPPSPVQGDRWTAEHVLDRCRYTLSRPAAAILVAAARPQEPAELVERMRALSPAGSADHWQGLVDDLRARALLVDPADTENDPRLRWLVGMRRRWSRFGWHEAVEYHALTFDYPCVDYAEGAGMLADWDRMRGYQAGEADADRVKLDYLDRPELPLPAPSGELPSASAAAVWAGSVPPAGLDAAALSAVLSLSFGPTGLLVPRTDSSPLLRRSSPSGGGRNPTEGYVVVRDVPGLEPGWHHVTMRPFGLRRLDGVPAGEGVLRTAFPGTLERFPGRVGALVVLTSVFDRNMYRYREPRTFRTVHMDAGHIASTVRLSARASGLAAGIYYCDNAARIEETLGLDPMREGYLATVAVADGTAASAVPAEAA